MVHGSAVLPVRGFCGTVLSFWIALLGEADDDDAARLLQPIAKQKMAAIPIAVLTFLFDTNAFPS